MKIRKNSFENNAWAQNRIVIGLDEVGRGCFAGPLVAAAVALPSTISQYRLATLKDSKVLTKEQRNSAYNWIVQHCYYGWGIVSPRVIESKNVWHATLFAMKKALTALLSTQSTMLPAPEVVLVDALPLTLFDLPYLHVPIHHAPRGEGWSSSIAAASIVAKVTRDRLMERMDTVFPGYHFSNHKGYGTEAHHGALNIHGHSLTHRTTFLKKFYEKRSLSGTQAYIE